MTEHHRASQDIEQAQQTAAFYDMDGTLISTNVVHAYAYYALHDSTLTGKLAKTAALLGKLPFFWAADKVDRKLFNEAFYKSYEGFWEDRLIVLGEEVFDKVIRPNIYPGALSLIKRSREQGHRQVLITGGIDYITRPFAEHLGFDDWVANSLEIKDGKATGRIAPPFIAGPNKAAWVREYAREHDVDLERSFAYADSGSDLPLLTSVGYPAAVNPDRSLRTTARSYNWPILDLTR